VGATDASRHKIPISYVNKNRANGSLLGVGGLRGEEEETRVSSVSGDLSSLLPDRKKRPCLYRLSVRKKRKTIKKSQIRKKELGGFLLGRLALGKASLPLPSERGMEKKEERWDPTSWECVGLRAFKFFEEEREPRSPL